MGHPLQYILPPPPPPSPPFRYYHHTVKVLILSVVLCWIGLMCTVIHLMEAGKSGWTSSSGFFKVVGELCFHASTAMLILLGMLLAKGMCITSYLSSTYFSLYSVNVQCEVFAIVYIY